MKHLKKFNESSLDPIEGSPEYNLISDIKDRLLHLEDMGGEVQVSGNIIGGKFSGYFICITFPDIHLHRLVGSSYSETALDINKFIQDKDKEVELFNQSYTEYRDIIKEIESMCGDVGFKITLLGIDCGHPDGVKFNLSIRP